MTNQLIVEEVHVNYLGYFNDWMIDPLEEYLKCKEQNHETITTKIKDFTTRHYCPICNISYDVDSSG